MKTEHVLLTVGVLAVGGAAAWYFYQKKKADDKTRVAIANTSPYQRDGSNNIGQNVVAGIDALENIYNQLGGH